MHKASIEGMGVDTSNNHLIVVLKAEGGLILPVVIGALETQNIMVHLSGETPARPLMPDLFMSTLELLGARVQRLEIVELKEGTYYGRLVLSQRGLEYEIDCRPSDGLALAVRAEAPILIADQVLQAGGVEAASLSSPNPQA